MTGVIDQSDAPAVTTEQVAKVVAGVSFIGLASRALERAGWSAAIVANRITVNHEIIAQFVAGTIDEPCWLVYTVTGKPPIWVVGAEVAS
jgi:hypothetical protein